MIGKTTKRRTSRRKNRTGSVLILITFLIVFLTLLVGTLLHALAGDLQIENNLLNSTKALYIAEAGVEYVIDALRMDCPIKNDYLWGTAFQDPFPPESSGTYTVIVDNEHPIVDISSVGEINGFQRKIEVQLNILESNVPYPIRILHWYEVEP